MKTRRPSHLKKAAFALPMVLWTVALLTSVILLLVGVIQGWVAEESHEGKVFRARQQALSGIAVAMNPSILPGDPLLEHRDKEGEGYKVVLKNESGLINPNTWLSANRRDLFNRLFTAWGLDITRCNAASDGLYDWQSPSPFRSLNGAKQPEYDAIGRSGLPPGTPFLSPDEMAWVIGFNPVAKARPDWKEFFTTYYSGKINILYAPKTILTDLLGLSPAQANAWIMLRDGKDGIEGSGDEPQIGSINEAADLIGANGSQRTLILDFCDITGSVRRIESTGFCHGVSHRIVVVGASTQNTQAGGSMLGWSEQ